MKKKVFFWRGNLYLLQQFSFLFAIICVVILFLNSFLTFEYVSGNQVYSNMYFINPFDSSGDFGEADVFTELLDRSISDIARFAVIKSQLEVDGQFDGRKVIDIITYANRKNQSGAEEAETFPASYYLEELIKWGKYDEMYAEVSFNSIWEAVSYFDEAVLEDYLYVVDIYQDEDFYLKYDGNLYYFVDTNGIYIPVYKGAAFGCTALLPEETEYDEIAMEDNEMAIIEGEEDTTNGTVENTEERTPQTDSSYPLEANVPSMLDMLVSTAYYYEIKSISSIGDYVIENESGAPTVVVNMLKERYQTVGGSTVEQLASDWHEYFRLCENLTYSVDSLSYNYKQYQAYQKEYNNSNLKFCLSMNMNGEQVFFGNDAVLLREDSDFDKDEYYMSNYDKYIIYCPDDMLYVTNTKIEEQRIFAELNHYSYAYPENTRMWIGVNVSNFTSGDKFAKAATVFDRFMPRAWLYMTEAVLGFLGWGISLVYLCLVTGKRKREDETEYTHIYWFDKMPTEIELVLAAGLGIIYLVGVYVNIKILLDNFTQIIEEKPIWIYVNAAGQALILSLLITVFLYSLVRRCKARNLWKNSITRYVFTQLWRVVKFFGFKIKDFVLLVYDNGKAMTRLVLPYLIMIFLNVLAGIFFYRYLYAGLSYGKYFLSLSFRSLMVCIILFFIFITDIGVLLLLLWNQIQRNKIVDGINQICHGDTAYKIDSESMHGENKVLAKAVNNIGDSIRAAVETSTKDEKLKADLITNVSHDIKTPLTSIINYVDLLKREHVETEPIKGYIEVLDAKSQRLKQLTDDLVEASKISSGNITLILERINLTELLKQATGEFEEKFSQKGLKMVSGYEKTPVCIIADSRRIWRVMENLLNNVYKYAMEGTRVYLDMGITGNNVKVSIKNISAQPLNIEADELTERFIRGDVSRSTEGSGLGLSIAKSLTIVQNGKFNIYLDGDLFKVTLSFPIAAEKEVTEDAAE